MIFSMFILIAEKMVWQGRKLQGKSAKHNSPPPGGMPHVATRTGSTAKHFLDSFEAKNNGSK